MVNGQLLPGAGPGRENNAECMDVQGAREQPGVQGCIVYLQGWRQVPYGCIRLVPDDRAQDKIPAGQDGYQRRRRPKKYPPPAGTKYPSLPGSAPLDQEAVGC